MTGQTTDGAHDSPTGCEPVELLVVLAPGSGTPPGPGAPPPPVPVPPVGPRPAYAPPPPPTRPLTALEALGEVVPVHHEYAPRLVLVELPVADAPRIAALPYVVGVYEAAPPPEVLATLGDLELIFVRAWLSRLDHDAHHGDDDRTGQGLPWDAPGYEPPDAATG
ncbi:hypothetical protein I6A60_12065 [Frankia sp. AgB1.9]|uniref:hypothetical protein n=1 Tax=unclassified Frankia TaxID=2632575 RepID=UPI001931E3AB|nr:MULTISPECIES: hypothetical protein [unclassified Frankia]MBL7489639.1 hypothetical protein [Frankia sp. AgW1.1]MBL7548605.1 hypothetical protein [Frankia sp. AgB1.9]MBL7621557.1 hypothetical protein [Frankia sp. AgB1.8]